MESTKHVALVAHDNRKKDLAEWVDWNAEKLEKHDIICTGTTGRLIEEVLEAKHPGNSSRPGAKQVTKLRSGPLGGTNNWGP